MRIHFILIGISIGIALVLSTVSTTNNQAVPVSQQKATEAKAINHDDIVQLTDLFMHTLVQETDENYRVLEYPDKESIVDAFKHITTEDVVKAYVDYYFYEENGVLYLVPTETPPWFDKQNGYDVVQLDKNTFLVTQDNQSELYGEYGIELEFTFLDQEWKITKITHL